MDPSTSSAQDVQNQKQSDTPVNRAQPPVTSQTQQAAEEPEAQSQSQKVPTTISVNKEAGPATIITETGNENDEEEVQAAPQEDKSQALQQRGVAEVEDVEIQPSVPEIKVEQSIENIVEKSPEQEEPEIPQDVADAGVTHSGPGVVIDNKDTLFETKQMPVTFQQAIEEEKKTGFRESRHWFAAMMIYIWRKLNLKSGKKGDTK